MKTISIFQVQDINNLLNQNNYDYVLKLNDTCGNQSLYLQCTGKTTDINELCNLINNYLKNNYLQVIPSTINPDNLTLK